MGANMRLAGCPSKAGPRKVKRCEELSKVSTLGIFIREWAGNKHNKSATWRPSSTPGGPSHVPRVHSRADGQCGCWLTTASARVPRLVQGGGSYSEPRAIRITASVPRGGGGGAAPFANTMLAWISKRFIHPETSLHGLNSEGVCRTMPA